ncbi:unnamed protein product [Closterium sp. Yama58-4]|nr:unnamed protein product [Closterium sp. Yama58-4]
MLTRISPETWQVGFQWTRSSDQVAASNAAPLVVEAPAADLEAGAVIVGASAISVAVPAVEVAVPAVEIAVPAVEVAVPAVEIEASAVEIETPAVEIAHAVDFIETADFSAGDASWLGVESGEVAPSFLVAEAQHGVKEGAEESTGCCRMNCSESSCSSHSACLISWDSCTSSSASSALLDLDFFADSYGSSGTNLMGVKMGIGRGFCSSGKGWRMEVKDAGQPVGKHVFPNLMFGENDESDDNFMFDSKGSVNKGIVQGLCSSGKGWSMGKNEFLNQQFGDYDDEDEDAGYSSQGLGLGGKGSVCYMNQLYMDEEEEEERSCLAASGISVGIGRFGARRRITGSRSRVTLRRMSASLRQF